MKHKLIFLAVFLLLLTGCGSATTAGYGYELAEPEDVETVQEVEEVQEEPPTGVEVVPEIQVEEEPDSVVSLPDLGSGEDSTVLEIGEKLFITQINDMYYNFQDYEDKTIIVEGMYALFVNGEGGSYPGVYRLGPGCCGNDGWGGFMLYYDGELPQENDWIRVTGTPELVKDEKGYSSLFLHVSSLVIMDERGAEFVPD